MIISGALEAGVALLLGIIGGVYIIGQINANAKRNTEDIEAIKVMIRDYQENVKDAIIKNMADVRALIDASKDQQRDSLNREISHIKDLIAMTSNETREDIKRLEARQAESNRVKERLAIAENSLKSLHKRLDVEPHINFREKEE